MVLILSLDKMAVQRLRDAAEKAKKELWCHNITNLITIYYHGSIRTTTFGNELDKS
jgi:molecular chaperone DnaK (HSP70)